MDFISNKAIMIAVGLFITITITTSIMAVIGQVKDIYKGVYETDISVQNKFTEYDSYDNAKKTGLDMYNTAKKYLNDPLVKVIYISNGNDEKILNTDSGINYLNGAFYYGVNTIKNETEFNTTISQNDDMVTIYFKK